MKRLFLSLILVISAHAQTPPPPTVTRTLTNGGTSLTVHFTHHPIRNPNYNVRVQNASGAFTLHSADVPRTYIGTVEGRPGAIAAGCQRANGTFLSFIAFENGTTWSSSGTSASAGGNANWPAVFPTTGVGSGGAGSIVRGAELGIDASYREYLATGSSVDACVELCEFYVMKANIVYLRDAAILHRIGRFVIRTSADQCPYEPMPNSTNADWSALLNKFRDQWNNVLPASPHNLPRTHDIALMVKPGIGGGLAWVGAVATSNSYSINGASSGDFSTIWRHEAGHNWGSSHFEGGGKPEGPTIMSDNSLARFSSSELAKIIAHRNSRLSSLDNLGSYPFPLPPRANQDRVTMTANTGGIFIDALDNDSDSNGETLSLHSFDTYSSLRGLAGRSPGTGPGGRDRIVFYSPPGYSSGFDHFNYRIQDNAGFQAVSKIYLNPAALPPLPPLWTAADAGSSTGDAGSGPGNTAVVYNAGADIWGTADSFRFVSREASGDCEIVARVTAQANSAPWAKAGVMIRDGTAANSAHAIMVVTPGNGFAFQYRSTAGGASTHVAGPALNAAPDNWVRLTRSGNTVAGWASADGNSWTQIASVAIPMASTARAGLAVAGNSASLTGGAAFDRIGFADQSPYRIALDDTFDSGASPTPFNDPADPLDTRWTPSGFNLSLAEDSTLGAGRALNAAATGNFAAIHGDIAGQALAVPGDILRLSFDFRHTASPANNAAGFRFGLHDAGGAGYSVHHGTGGATGYALAKSPDSFGTGGNLTNLVSSTKTTLNNTAKHHATLEIERTATGLALRATVDGVEITAADDAPVITAFDTVVIRNGNLNANFRVDNVRVESFHPATPAFQPGTLAAATAAPAAAYSGSLSDFLVAPNPAFTFAKISGPSWLSVAPDGTLSGAPSAADLGENAFTVRVQNATGEFADATLLIHVAHPVSAAAATPSVPEEGPGPAIFTFTRQGPTGAPLTVRFTLSGTATPGGDYIAPPLSITIPADQNQTTLEIDLIDDNLLEDPETIVLTLTASNDYAIAPPPSATVAIIDDESFFVRLHDTFDSPAATPGDDADDSGDAAWTSSGSTLSVVADNLLGPAGNKSLNVATTANFPLIHAPFAARTLPADGDALTLSFDIRFTTAPGNNGEGFRFGLANAAGNGFFACHGTGGSTAYLLREDTGGGFGAGSSTNVTGSSTKATLNDTAVHRASLTLRRVPTGIRLTSVFDGVSLSAIDTNPVISSFDTAVVRLGNINAPFRIDNVRVEFTPNRPPLFAADPIVRSIPIGAPFLSSIAGDVTDPGADEAPFFSKISGPAWLTIEPDGALSGTAPAEIGAHSFTVRATDAFGLFTDATLLIHTSDQTVTVATPFPFARESGGLDGAFLVTRTGPLDSDLAVHFALSGAATEGDDYTAPASPIVIPAGQTSVAVTITPIADDFFEGDETVILTLLQSPAYFAADPSSATVTIIDAQNALDLVHDTFDIGSPPTHGNDAADPLDTAWTATGFNLSLAEDATLGTGRALAAAATGNFSALHGAIPAQTLVNPGDTLRLSFDFRHTAVPANNVGGFRFGFFNAAGAGYAIQHGTGGSTGYALLHGPDGFGSGGNTTSIVSASKSSLNDTARHQATLEIQRTAAGFALRGTFDGVEIAATTDAPVTTAFDQVSLRNGNINASFRIDNVHVSLELNRPPFFTSAPLLKPSASPGSPYLESLSSDIDDPNPGDTLAIAKIDGPGWLEISPEGILSGTPDTGDTGTNHFTIRITDPHGLSAESLLVIEVAAPSSPIETWRLLHFGEDFENPAIAGDDADPDGDGLSNLVEYALGLDPKSPSASPAAAREGDRFAIFYTLDLLAVGVTVEPEWSAGLSTWESDGILIETLGEEDSIRSMKASIPAAGNTAFLRLKVAAP